MSSNGLLGRGTQVATGHYVEVYKKHHCTYKMVKKYPAVWEWYVHGNMSGRGEPLAQGTTLTRLEAIELAHAAVDKVYEDASVS